MTTIQTYNPIAGPLPIKPVQRPAIDRTRSA